MAGESSPGSNFKRAFQDSWLSRERRTFLPAIAGALALAVLFARLHRWIEATTTKRPNLAAMHSVLIVVVPATFVVELVIREAAKGALLTIAPIGGWIDQQIDLPAIIGKVVAWLSNIRCYRKARCDALRTRICRTDVGSPESAPYN